MKTIVVELTEYEARALAFAGQLADACLEPLAAERGLELPDGHSIAPLQSGVLKLELAMITEHVEA